MIMWNTSLITPQFDRATCQRIQPAFTQTWLIPQPAPDSPRLIVDLAGRTIQPRRNGLHRFQRTGRFLRVDTGHNAQSFRIDVDDIAYRPPVWRRRPGIT